MTIKRFNAVYGVSVGDDTILDVIDSQANVAANNLSVTGTSNLNSIGNITILGGSSGQVLSTDGFGVLSWTSTLLNAQTVTTAAQPNITSVGTLTSLTVSGNITVANAALGNLATANFFQGNGSLLTSLTGANVTGIVANANYSTNAGTSITAGTVYTNAQPNITSVGTLTSLTVTGNVSAGNISGGNLVSATYLSGNGNLITGLTLASSLGDTLITSPTNGQLLGYNGVNWVNTNNTTSVSAGAGVDYWLTSPIITATSANNVIQIDSLSTTPNTGAQSYASVTVNGTAVIAAFAAPALGRTVIDAGNWDFSVWANVNNTGGTATLATGVWNTIPYSGGTVTITGTGTSRTATSSNGSPFASVTPGSNMVSSSYLQTPNGLYRITAKTSNTVVTIDTPSGYTNESAVASTVWNPLFNFNSTSISSTSLTEYILGTTQPQFNITLASSIGVLFVITTSNNRTVYITIDGTQQASHFLTPLHNLHDDLAGLQGGQASEYYHLTNAEYTGTGTGNFVRQDTPQLITPNIGSATGTSLVLTANITAGNASLGNSATANFFTGTLTTADQPNVTSVGTLTSLAVTANVSASYFIGNGSLLTGLTGANVTGQVSYAAVANSVAGGNVSGQVSNALIAGTVYTNAQPNITSVGTLSSLAVTANITSGNISGGNLVSANYFSGNGSLLSSLTGGNVTGQVSNSLVSGTVYTNAQPNITSVGTLSSLVVTANITSGNISGGNLVSANYFSGNGSLLSSITGANVTGQVSYAGTANSVAGGNVSGQVSYAAVANSVAGGNVSGQVSNALVSGTVYTNAQPNITSVGTLTDLTMSGTGTISGANLVSANYFSGNGSLLTAITGANVTGQVSYAATANSVAGGNVSGQVSNALIAGTVYTNAQPNITSIGTLIGLSMISTASIQGGNLVSATYISGNGSLLTALNGSNVTGQVSYSAVANSVAGANVTGQVSNALVSGTVYTNAQPNITSVGTLSSLAVSANITSGNISGGNLVSANYFQGNGSLLTALTGANVTGQVSYAAVANSVAGGNVSGQVSNALVAGTVYTNAQPNITSVGTLTSLAVSGTATIASASDGVVTYFGNASSSADKWIAIRDTFGEVQLGTNGSTGAYIFNVAASPLDFYTNSTKYLSVSTTGETQVLSTTVSSSTTTGALQVSGGAGIAGKIYSLDANLGNAVTANYFIGNGKYLDSITGGNVTGYVANATHATVSDSANSVTGSNVSGQVSNSLVSGTVYTNAQPNITSVGTLTDLTMTDTASITGGNLVRANYIKGDGSLLSSVTGANVTGQVGNALVAGTVYTNAQPNITSLGTLSSLVVSANITSGNISGGNLVSANYFSGDGSLLTSVNGVSVSGQVSNALVSGTVYTNAQPNITSVGTLTSLVVSANITAGNIAGGNLVSANYFSGNASLLSSITGANVTGQVNYAATANSVAGANVTGQVNYAATANSVAGGNVSGAVGLATYATTANAVAGANVSGQVANSLVAGTVYTNAQPNITSVGTLTDINVSGNATIGGNLTVNGTLTSINSTIVQIDDLAIVLANDASSTTQANGAGIIINGASANMLYIASTNSFTFTHKISADGSLLSSLTGANVTGQVSYAAVANSVAAGNISGQVSNSLVAGTVYTNAQPNITSVGTLTGLSVLGDTTLTGNLTVNGLLSNISVTTLSVQDNIIDLSAETIGTPSNNAGIRVIRGDELNTQLRWNEAGTTWQFTNDGVNYLSIVGKDSAGNITVGNVAGGNLVSASYISGNGSLLSSLTGANVTGQVGNSLISGTVYTNAQPNITSVGSLTGLTSTGILNFTGASNIALGTVGNVHIGGGGAGQYLTTDGSGALSWASISGSGISNGTSNVSIPVVNGNVNISSAGSPNILVVTGTGVNVSGTLNATGTATAGYFSGNGSLLTAITGANVTGQVGYAAVANSIAGGNVSGAVGLATYATTANSVAGANVSGAVGLATYATTANSVAGANVSGEVAFAAVANSVAGGNVSGAVGLATYATTANSVAGGNVSGAVGLATYATTANSVAGANVSGQVNYAATANSVAGANVSGQVNYAATANSVAGANVSGQVSNALIAGTVYTNAQANITSLGTLTELTVDGITTLGTLANVKITGGGSGYVIQTDGLGNLSWTSSSGGGGSPSFISASKDQFTGTGSATNFSLSTIPTSKDAIVVNIDGLVQLASSYSLSGSTLSFATAPYYGERIEVTTYGVIAVSGGNTQVQYSNGAGFASSSSFTFNDSTNLLTVGGNISGANLIATGGYVTIDTGIIAVSSGQAGIFTTGVSNLNIGLLANVTLGSTTGNATARGNLIVNGNISTTANISANIANLTAVNAGNGTITGTMAVTNLKVNDFYSNRAPVSVTTDTVIDQFPVNRYRSAKYTIKVGSDDGYQAVEALLVHNGAAAYVTIYGSISTSGYDIVMISATVDSGNVQLLATTVSTNTSVNLLGTYVAD